MIHFFIFSGIWFNLALGSYMKKNKKNEKTYKKVKKTGAPMSVKIGRLRNNIYIFLS